MPGELFLRSSLFVVETPDIFRISFTWIFLHIVVDENLNCVIKDFFLYGGNDKKLQVGERFLSEY